MDDTNLMRYLSVEIKKERIIYDKSFQDILQYANRERRINMTFDKIAADIKKRESKYFWLKG